MRTGAPKIVAVSITDGMDEFHVNSQSFWNWLQKQ
jgi:hypothetical protein